MVDTVGGGKGRLGKLIVAEFNGFGEQRGLVGAVHDVKAAVVVEGRSNVEAITGTKVTRLASVGIVVDEEFVSKGVNWCGVVAMGAVEVIPGGDVRIQCGLVE